MKRPFSTLTCGAPIGAALLIFVACPSSAQAPTPNKSAPVSCNVRHTPSTEADIAFSHAKYDDAIALYRKEAGAPGDEGERIHNALIRTEIRAQKLDDATADAKAWAASSPKDAWALTSLGEVQFRNGEIDDAGKSMRAAAAANFCVAQVHADYAIYLSFVGFHASAKTQLDIAHKLDPVDDQISGDWTNSQPRAARAAAIDAYIAHTPFLTDKERKSWEDAKEQLNKPSLYPCRLTSSVTSTTIPFHGIRSGATRTDIAWGLSVAFNGVQRRLEIDTGASGLLLNHSAATELGLQIESRTKSSGFGDEGQVGTSVALVKHLKIGDLVFEDCAVRILDKDQMPNQDGLIGGDVFRNFVLTIDFPGRVLKLDPLPLPPGVDAASVDHSVQTGVSSDESTPRDRYVDHPCLRGQRFSGWDITCCCRFD